MTTTGTDSSYVRPMRSLVDEAAVALRASILSGEIRAGARIRIQDLEDRLGISRIPIREALRQLESEGLVKTTPHRATVATPLSLTELWDVYDVREALEIRVAKRSVARLRPELHIENRPGRGGQPQPAHPFTALLGVRTKDVAVPVAIFQHQLTRIAGISPSTPNTRSSSAIPSDVIAVSR